jgi:predicted DsbA family dithiol-disulfide isomerase
MPSPELAGLVIEAFIDHACPHCALQAAALRALGGGVLIRWRVVPQNGRLEDLPPAERRMHAARFIADWPRVAELGAERFGWSMRRPDWPVDSRPAAAAAALVRRRRPESETALHAAIFDARFLEGRDIGAPAELQTLVSTVAGTLIGREVPRAVEESAIEVAPAPDRRAAEALALRAVPALLVADRLLVGARSPAALEGIVAQARAEVVA